MTAMPLFISGVWYESVCSMRSCVLALREAGPSPPAQETFLGQRVSNDDISTSWHTAPWLIRRGRPQICCCPSVRASFVSQINSATLHGVSIRVGYFKMIASHFWPFCERQSLKVQFVRCLIVDSHFLVIGFWHFGLVTTQTCIFFLM